MRRDEDGERERNRFEIREIKRKARRLRKAHLVVSAQALDSY